MPDSTVEPNNREDAEARIQKQNDINEAAGLPPLSHDNIHPASVDEESLSPLYPKMADIIGASQGHPIPVAEELVAELEKPSYRSDMADATVAIRAAIEIVETDPLMGIDPVTTTPLQGTAFDDTKVDTLESLDAEFDALEARYAALGESMDDDIDEEEYYDEDDSLQYGTNDLERRMDVLRYWSAFNTILIIVLLIAALI
jgi:hypothetical protein